jgi:glycosyltransferase involved in cell wall biosynthesis
MSGSYRITPPVPAGMTSDTTSDRPAAPSVAMLPWGDRFEDFYDRIGVSLDVFREEYTGGWLFNYVDAMHGAGLRPVLFFFSVRVASTVRFRHVPTGARVVVLPTPRGHQRLRGTQERYWPGSKPLTSLASYIATPWRALARELRLQGCQAILCHEYEYPRFDVAVWLGALLEVPVFATFQAADGPLSAIEMPLRRLAMRRAAGFVIAASAERRRVRERYGIPAAKIAATPNPFDVRRWTPGDRASARQELGIAADAVVVEWHGRVQMRRKGLDVLLDAWAAVCSHLDEHLLLLLVGTGRDHAELRAAIQGSHHAATIRWVDHYVLDRAALWHYLSAADIAVLPSRHEGFAVAAVEALAGGRPLVASDVPGVIDAVGSDDAAAGIIVPVADAGALASGLERLITDPVLRAELGTRGRRRAETYFSLEKVGAELRAFMTSRGGFHADSGRQIAEQRDGSA